MEYTEIYYMDHDVEIRFNYNPHDGGFLRVEIDGCEERPDLLSDDFLEHVEKEIMDMINRYLQNKRSKIIKNIQEVK